MFETFQLKMSSKTLSKSRLIYTRSHGYVGSNDRNPRSRSGNSVSVPLFLSINYFEEAMKKSSSRTSKLSTDGGDPSEIPLPGIPDAKWHDFLEKEETDLFILGLREEIMNKCMEICLNNYLEKQAVAFTVHCAYLAWCKVLNIYYMVRDPGYSDDPKEQKSWEPDLEPEPSKIDSWGRQCIKTLAPPPPPPKIEKESERQARPTPSSIQESVEFSSFYSNLFDMEEGEFVYSPNLFLPADLSKTRSRSSFGCCTSDSESVLKFLDEKICNPKKEKLKKGKK